MSLTDQEKYDILNQYKTNLANEAKNMEIQEFTFDINRRMQKDPLTIDKELTALESKLGIVKTP